MRFRFLHCSDAHLGKHHQTGAYRYLDYFAALSSVVKHAVAQSVDAVLVAGDLFDEQDPSFETLRLALRALRPLRENSIPLYVIEGNHDRRKRTEPSCALDILASEGYAHVLRPDINDQNLILSPYSPEKGGCIARPADGITITGLGFFGHNVEDYFRQAWAQLPENTFNIMLFHTMVVHDESKLEYGYCLYSEIESLHDRIGYLALGHRHTRIGLDDRYSGWMYNPGSLEFVNSFDYRQSADLRGFLDVTITDEPEENELKDFRNDFHVVRNAGKYLLKARHIPTRKRPAYTVASDISSCELPGDVIETTLSDIRSTLTDEQLAARPILIIRLKGSLRFSRSLIPKAAIIAAAMENTGSIHVDALDEELIGSITGEKLMTGDDHLVNVLDRARAITAEILEAYGIAVGSETDLASALMDAKEDLRDAAENPHENRLQEMRNRLRQFIPKEGGNHDH